MPAARTFSGNARADLPVESRAARIFSMPNVSNSDAGGKSAESRDGREISLPTLVDEAKLALAVASSFEEVKDIRDRARAWELLDVDR